MKYSEVAERLDVLDNFWKQIKTLNEKIKKEIGLCKIENIDSANICTIAINPKEYFEKVKNRTINKTIKA